MRRFSSSANVLGRDVFIYSGTRTPTGSFLASLKSVKAVDLGSVAVKAAVERSGAEPHQIQEVFLGNVLQAGLGQAPARQAALGAGLPQSVPCTTVNKVCASGMKAVMFAAQGVATGQVDVAVAGGFESMSNAPHLVQGARQGMKFGHGKFIDAMLHDGLTDPWDGHVMGVCGEDTAAKMGFTRQQQDEYAVDSYKRAGAAAEAGHFKAEIAPVTIPGRKGDTVVSEDEEWRRIDFAKVSSLRPAFKKDGTVTAANASTLNDGASALVVGAEGSLSSKPIGRIVSFGDAAAAPIDFPTAPAKAIPIALARAGLTTSDIDYWEINEAFSVVGLANAQILGIERDKLNHWGGGVSLGHPIGSSGSRIIVTLLSLLKAKGKRYGCAAICNGGGGASAIIVENLDL